MSRTDDHEPTAGQGEIEALLARARRGLSPSAADAERIRRSIAGALAGGTAAGRANPSDALAAPAPTGRIWSWGGRLLAGATIAAVAGSSGYLAGERAGRRASEPIARPATAPASTAAEPPIESPPQPQPTTPAPAIARPAAPRTTGHRQAIAAPTPSPAPSLEEEVRAVRAVERALRDGRPSLALALLHELDRAIPDGRLGEERAATNAIARCTLGQIPLDVYPAEDFAERHAGSPYLDRVRQACARANGVVGPGGENQHD